MRSGRHDQIFEIGGPDGLFLTRLAYFSPFLGILALYYTYKTHSFVVS